MVDSGKPLLTVSIHICDSITMNTMVVRIITKCKETLASTKTPMGKALHKVHIIGGDKRGKEREEEKEGEEGMREGENMHMMGTLVVHMAVGDSHSHNIGAQGASWS